MGVGTQTIRHFKVMSFPCPVERQSEEAAVGGCVYICSGRHRVSSQPLKEGRTGAVCEVGDEEQEKRKPSGGIWSVSGNSCRERNAVKL